MIWLRLSDAANRTSWEPTVSNFPSPSMPWRLPRAIRQMDLSRSFGSAVQIGQLTHLMQSTGLASIPACASGKSISGTQLIKVCLLSEWRRYCGCDGQFRELDNRNSQKSDDQTTFVLLIRFALLIASKRRQKERAPRRRPHRSLIQIFLSFDHTGWRRTSGRDPSVARRIGCYPSQ